MAADTCLFCMVCDQSISRYLTTGKYLYLNWILSWKYFKIFTLIFLKGPTIMREIT